MALTDAERATYTRRLSEAEDALHRLNIGQAFVEIRDQNGEIAKYTPANATRLRAYIYEMKVKLGLAAVAGPMKMWGY